MKKTNADETKFFWKFSEVWIFSEGHEKNNAFRI